MGIRLVDTPDGRSLVVSREMAADPDAVWRLLVTVDRWPEWGPSVTAVDCSDAVIESGTTGHVQVLGGPWLSFEITSCSERRWTWDVAGIRATGHRVEPRGEDRTRVGFEIPPLAAGYAPVCWRALDRIERVVEREAE